MNGPIITSRDNALAKRARAVRDGKVRDLIFIEGVRLCEEAVRAGLTIQDVICTEELSDADGALSLGALKKRAGRVAIVSEQVLAYLSDTKTPQGILFLAARPQAERSALDRSSDEPTLIVVMHRINNPSNAGAIIRTAEAAGATGVVATEGSTDLFSPKALRGAMGSSFRLPLWTGAGFSEVLAWCAQRGIHTVAADIRSTRAHTDVDWTVSCALIVGAEASGLSAAEKAEVDEAIRIPMRAPVDSLNVAVAAAITLYEAVRQRQELQT